MGALRILEIEIDNFKTFRHEVIPFLPGFTAMSGANGSGKSNILDGLLWGMGLSSNRTLRAEKGTDLINNASNRRDARVTVRLGVDGTDERIEISRRIRESLPQAGGPPAANHTYYLNGRVSSHGEVLDLLGRHHISPSGYNVVMQGDVTSIIRMTAAERRRIIDEVAGVADFDYRIDQAHKELQAVFEQEERTALLLGELQARLEALRAERDQALRYLDLIEAVKRCELAVRLADRWDLAQSVKGLQAVVAHNGAQQAQLAEAREKTAAELAAAREVESDLADRLRAEGGTRLEELDSRIQQSWSDSERARLAREAALGRSAELAGAAGRDEELIARHRDAVASAQARAAELDAQKQAHEAEALRLEAERKRLQADLDQLLGAKADVRERVESLRARRGELFEKLNLLQVEQYAAEARRRDAEDRLERQRAERASYLAQLREAELEAGRAGEVADRAGREADAAREDGERCRAMAANLHAQLAQVEQALTEARNAFTVAETQLRAQEQTMGTAVDLVLEAAIPGVVGTLLQLGEADPEYARALQEAAGSRLRNIVVADDAVAAKVSRLLHGKQIGRVTCLPLNKLQPARRLPPVKAAGCVGYALEKVKFDPRYADAFFHAFGDTLIFESLDQARPHIGQYRMVTLDGDVLDKGGAMTVGRSRSEPALFLASLRATLEQRKAAMQAAAQRVTQHQEAHARMKASAESAGERLRSAEQAAHEAELRRQTAHARSQEAQTRLAECDQAIALGESELLGLESAVEAAIDARLPFDEESNALDEALAELEGDLGDERLTELSEAIQNAGWAAGSAQGEARAAEAELQAVARNHQEAELALTQAEAERRRRLDEASAARAEAGRLQADIDALAADQDRLGAEREEAKAGLEALAAEREAARERRFELERQADARAQELERFLDGMRLTADKLDEQARKLQATENGLWEDGIEAPEGRPDMTSAQAEAARQEAAARLDGLGPVNQLAIEQFEREDARATEYRNKLEALRGEREGIEARIGDISGQKRAVFMGAFDQIDGHFGAIFTELAGGHAQLSLESAHDPFAGGLVIHAQPPGSRVYRLEAMSGGEKSLTALAFLFAIQRTQPAPFYALDEVDHALDGVNVERLARMITRQAEHAQMIVISHRKPMIAHSDQAIGVHARPDGSSRVTGIRWGRAAAAAGE